MRRSSHGHFVNCFHGLAGTREDLPAPEGWIGRGKRAHANMVENIGPFAVAVLAAEWLGIHTPLTAACAMIFFWARAAHPIMQVLRIWGTRTVTFAIGVGATLVYLVAILLEATK